MNSHTMYNPTTNVTIITNDKFKSKWERLGFVELGCNIIPFKLMMAV